MFEISERILMRLNIVVLAIVLLAGVPAAMSQNPAESTAPAAQATDSEVIRAAEAYKGAASAPPRTS